jgi:competence protein ComEC
MRSPSIETHQSFWNSHPAVLLGVSFLIGTSSLLFSLPLWICAGWIAYILALKKWVAAAILPMAALYSWLLFGQLPELSEPKQIVGNFAISSVKINKTPFTTNLLYKGTLFIDTKGFPCSITVPYAKRKTASCDYRVKGTLLKRDRYDYLLKPKTWEAIPRTWSLAEARYKAKEALKRFLHKQLTLPHTATLLNSLATGDVEDRMLRYEFSRLGLQHILAISGFHFGVLIAFLSLILRVLPNKFQWLSMIVLTTTYYLFIGDSPAVQRAWIIVTLFLIAKLIRRPTTPINLLGAALLAELIYNPLIASNLGFQFSFGSCFGILLLYRPINEALKTLLPTRPAAISARLPFLSGLAYLLCKSCRSAISLTTAVNIALLPLLLLHFGKFPLLSLVYNLFIPFLISLILLLLLGSILLSVLSTTLAKPLFFLLDQFTAQILDLISYPPLALDYSIYIQNFSMQWIPIYLCLLLHLAIRINSKSQPSRYCN